MTEEAFGGRNAVFYPAESGLQETGSGWSIIGVTASHADNTHGNTLSANHFPPGIIIIDKQRNQA